MIDKRIRFVDIENEKKRLSCLMNKTRASFELNMLEYKKTKFKFYKWLIKLEMDELDARYNDLLCRYKVIQELSHNFNKFIPGISKKDFANTNRLSELLDRLKFIESLNDLKVCCSSATSDIRDIKSRLDNRVN